MDEQSYEKLVDRLAQRYENTILDVAIATIEGIEHETPDVDADTAINEAHDVIFNDLIGDPRWEPVEAVDISDIARDAANRAWSQTRAWMQQ